MRTITSRILRRPFTQMGVSVIVGSLFAWSSVAQAALPVGAHAPDFVTRGAKAGKIFNLRLSDALKKGPVVLYFFPAAFTPGCTAEAHEFAEAADDFIKAGATVIGMSADPVDKLAKFSTEHCQDKFAVASAGPRVILGYQVPLAARAGLTDRTTYVISRTGRIAYAYTAMDYRDHVKNALSAVRAMQVPRE